VFTKDAEERTKNDRILVPIPVGSHIAPNSLLERDIDVGMLDLTPLR
jgi:hypothetical protein